MRKALVIGLNEYPRFPLNGCVNDANAVAEILSKNGDGSPNFGVNKILNRGTRRELLQNIRALFDGNSDVELLYFSGHGMVADKISYIVSTDYEEENWGIKLDEILSIANESHAKHKIIILDSCHSGAMGTPEMFGNSCSQIGEGLTIFTSSLASEASLEGGGHGVFTSLLIDALKGGAADIVGNISPGSVYAYIDKALGPWEQRPVFKTNVSSFLPIRKVEPAIPLECLRKLATYFADVNQPLRLDPSFEETNLPGYPHEVVEPYANANNVLILKDLQKLESVGLVQPVDAEHMYYAAMHSKSCRLTPLGRHFWYLVSKGKI